MNLQKVIKMIHGCQLVILGWQEKHVFGVSQTLAFVRWLSG
jgi:hypothetical protein